MKTIDQKEALQLCLEAEQITPEERAKLREKRLRDLVSYAKEHSPYFKELYKNIGDDYTIRDLPATCKSELMKDYSSWVTDPEVKQEDVMAYMVGPDAVHTRYLGKYTALATSGTTGNPMPMIRDAHRNTIHGILMQTRLMRDTDPDILNPTKHKIASLIALDPGASTYSSFRRAKQAFPGYEDNMIAVSIISDVDTIINTLNEFQPDVITAYPSVLGPVIKAQKDGRLHISPKTIATSAELLSQNVYHALRETFQCPVLNNYCSAEGGEAAMSCSEGHLHINDDWVIIEPVDRDGKPVKPGEWSDGILVTDLANYAQPVIRYYMEDKVRIHTEPCACGSTLPVMDIRGRMIENIVIGDKEIFAITVDHYLADIAGLYSVQLVHKAPTSFEVRLISESEAEREIIFEKIKSMLEEIFGKSGCPDVEITLSTEPLIHSERGGKVKRIIKIF